jgi:hypothetical protein
MLTVGLVRELLFIAKATQIPINAEFSLNGLYPSSLKINLKPDGEMYVWYNLNLIWKEIVEGDVSFFGVESCDSIARIIACIDNGTTWDHLKWTDSLDKSPSLV